MVFKEYNVKIQSKDELEVAFFQVYMDLKKKLIMEEGVDFNKEHTVSCACPYKTTYSVTPPKTLS